MKISILFGTETGNAEMLCDDIQEHLEVAHSVETSNLEDMDPQALSAERLYLFVCSTYGDGELPQSAIPFVETLKAKAPDLSGVRFSIFGLGDTIYDETYNNGSVVLMTALTNAGAKLVGPRGLHDASGLEDAAEIALSWADARIAEIEGCNDE